jgi:hypothetical protein
MKAQASKAKNDAGRSVADGLAQRQRAGEFPAQLVDERAEAVAQRRVAALADGGPRAARSQAYQAIADGGARAKPAPIVQRTVVGEDDKPIDVDAFIAKYMVPRYANSGALPAETDALTAAIKAKIAPFFGPDAAGDAPRSLAVVQGWVRDGMMGFDVDAALASIRPKAEGEAPADAEAPPAEVESAQGAGEAPAEAAAMPALAGAGVQKDVVAEEAAVEPAKAAKARPPGDPNSLAVGLFESLGGGRYGSTREVQASDVDRVVNRSIKKNVKLTVLSGTHGDHKGWLIGEEDFAKGDKKALEAVGVIVHNVNGLSKGAIKSLIDGATTPAVLLAWCFSKESYDNWDAAGDDAIHAIFTKVGKYRKLNDQLTDLIDQGDPLVASIEAAREERRAAKKEEREEDYEKACKTVTRRKARYEKLRKDIKATRAEMLALLDW